MVLRRFGTSSIDFAIYYWHASDVPSELAATHDLMLAIHHALADADITIAFPQLVVWPSHDEVANPYDAQPGTVYTPHAHESGDAGKPTGATRWRTRQRSE